MLGIKLGITVVNLMLFELTKSLVPHTPALAPIIRPNVSLQGHLSNFSKVEDIGLDLTNATITQGSSRL